MSHIYRGQLPSFYLRRSIPLIAIGLFLLSLTANAWTFSARAIAPGIETQSSAHTSTPAPTASAATASAPGAATTAVATTSPIVRQTEAVSCSTNRAYRAPEAINLAAAQDGLTINVSEPYTYTVTASSLTGLRSGIANCPIRIQSAGNYHAITARQISWSYGFSQNSVSCTLTSVRVGLSITQLLPEFAPATGTSQSTINSWNTYHTNLVTHEGGHVDVAKLYAAELVSKLNTLSSTDCSSLKTVAAATVDAQLAALNSTDTGYDTSTNHGATQGAVL